MQVSSVCMYKFLSTDVPETKNQDTPENPANETSSSVFTSSLKNSGSVFDNIGEWKSFCQKQIMAENLDYIA